MRTTFDGVQLVTTADADGVWRQRLPPTNASMQAHALRFEGEGAHETASLSDVLFGDVFLCGGQSNMVAEQ